MTSGSRTGENERSRGTARRLVLASGSPRRSALLREAGFEFEVSVPDISETAQPGEAPERLAHRLATAKAQVVAARMERTACILAADTLVIVESRILGKPGDEREAAWMLLQLAGREHRVLTGFALLVPDLERCETGVEESRVRMRNIEPHEARAYAATGEPLDKAGAYAVQGAGGRFVLRIEGSRSNVIGLPLESIVPRLHELGVRARCRP